MSDIFVYMYKCFCVYIDCRLSHMKNMLYNVVMSQTQRSIYNTITDTSRRKTRCCCIQAVQSTMTTCDVNV